MAFPWVLFLTKKSGFVTQMGTRFWLYAKIDKIFFLIYTKMYIQRPAHRMQVKFVFHTMSTEMCFLIISSVELQVFTLKFTSQGFIAEFLYFDLVKNDCQVEGRKSIRPTECRSTFCYLSWQGKVHLGQFFGWVHYLKLPWSVWCNNRSVNSLTMPNLQNLGYTAHRMQVS